MFTNGRFARVALGLALFLTTIAWSSSASAAARWQGDAVYTATNAASGNAVLVFDRNKDGMLMAAGEYATGGLGSGDALGSQGAVIMDARCLSSTPAAIRSRRSRLSAMVSDSSIQSRRAAIGPLASRCIIVCCMCLTAAAARSPALKSITPVA